MLLNCSILRLAHGVIVDGLRLSKHVGRWIDKCGTEHGWWRWHRMLMVCQRTRHEDGVLSREHVHMNATSAQYPGGAGASLLTFDWLLLLVHHIYMHAAFALLTEPLITAINATPERFLTSMRELVLNQILLKSKRLLAMFAFPFLLNIMLLHVPLQAIFCCEYGIAAPHFTEEH